ncbi:hypothetical protein [Nonomuraea sp. NPDC050540]|uniref:hypothetical protein n=1 Tax=Nonomuraea sp. NPDC050540 TaxID=3364367 RepID=UPI0037B7ADE0
MLTPEVLDFGIAAVENRKRSKGFRKMQEGGRTMISTMAKRIALPIIISAAAFSSVAAVSSAAYAAAPPNTSTADKDTNGWG